nr:type II toxin-antitoxin system RelE/ParE family toxin [uncultured Enterobacter sp.]
MLFIETEIFAQDVKALLTHDEYIKLQYFLTINADFGDVIQDTGGLRKIRWKSEGMGKRGGVRVIYFHRAHESQIRFLLIYRKGIKDDLSKSEKAILRKMNERW